MIPKLKHITHFVENGELVFQPDVGIELRIEDPEGQIHHLVRLLDGTRSVGGVHTDMLANWPDLSVEDMREGLDGLGEAGLLEDAGGVSALTEQQEDRYGGNLAFFAGVATLRRSRSSFQERLLHSHVLLLGAGGVGCSLLMNLAGLGVGHVTLVDYDTVELGNLNRQFLYKEATIGHPKVERAADWVRDLNSEMRITPVSRKITCTGDIASLLGDVDLVLSAIDEPPTEVDRWVNEACVQAGIPVVLGGLRISRALYFSMQPGVSGCLECLRMVSGTDGLGETELALDPHATPSIAPAVTLVGGLIGMECLRYLTGFAPPVSAGKVWLIDLYGGAVDIGFEWERQPDCPVCGDDRR